MQLGVWSYVLSFDSEIPRKFSQWVILNVILGFDEEGSGFTDALGFHGVSGEDEYG